MDSFLFFLTRIYSLGLKAIARYLSGGAYFCCYCQKRSLYFLPYRIGPGDVSQFISSMDLIGSDVANHSCAKCGSHDRERHLKLYFDQMGLNEIVAGSCILHFAPERFFSDYLANLGPLNYIKADLHPISTDVKCVDVTKMQFDDNSFDLVVANHVLEHVGNDTLALSELNRVLRPFSMILSKTFEDPGIHTDALRLQIYGQEDHMRLYGSNIVEYIESFGFQSKVKEHGNLLASIDSGKYGVNPREPFFLFTKT